MKNETFLFACSAACGLLTSVLDKYGVDLPDGARDKIYLGLTAIRTAESIVRSSSKSASKP
jgi:hypothetical protein